MHSPVAGVQKSTVHSTPSSQLIEVPGTHCPEASHVSEPLHKSASAQSPLERQSTHCPRVSEQKLGQVGGEPAWQLPAEQVSRPLQNNPSSQSASVVQSGGGGVTSA